MGSKVYRQKAPNCREAIYCHNRPRSNGNTTVCRFLGRRLDSLLDDCHQRHRRHLRPTRVRTADPKVRGRMHYHSAIPCHAHNGPPHCLESSLPLKKSPNCVFLSN